LFVSRLCCQHGQRIAPVKADLAGLVLELERTGEGREGDRHAAKRPVAALGGVPLFGDGPDDVPEPEQSGFLGHPGMKHELLQEIAELVAQIAEIAALDRRRWRPARRGRPRRKWATSCSPPSTSRVISAPIRKPRCAQRAGSSSAASATSKRHWQQPSEKP
jgi:hypothetical protein